MDIAQVCALKRFSSFIDRSEVSSVEIGLLFVLVWRSDGGFMSRGGERLRTFKDMITRHVSSNRFLLRPDNAPRFVGKWLDALLF